MPLRSYANVHQSRVHNREQTASNQALQYLLRTHAAQAKLTVNIPNDEYEREADRVADHVMRLSIGAADGPPNIQRKCGACSEEIEARRIQRMCDECEEENVPRKEKDGATVQISRDLESEILALEGTGAPMSQSTRDFFEPRFGRDFSNVRMHVDGQAAETAKSAHALAYARGNHIVVASGQYAPETSTGKRLLAHELAHVVQQSDSRSLGRVQRVAESSVLAPGGCDPSPPLPSRERWSANSTLNDIRAEAAGDNRVLVRRGQKGEAVQLVQQALVAWGCEQLSRNLLPRFGADGDFGSETETAVREFQSFTEIASDGLVGPITLSRLDAFVVFGEIPEFPPGNCKVIPPDSPPKVVRELADLGFVTSSDLLAATTPSERAVAAGLAGIPILCDLGKGGGGGGKAPPGICTGTAISIASIGNATFALCDFRNASRMSAGAVPHPGPGNEVGFVEMRALGIRLFASVGTSLPTSGPGSADTDWQHGFIQTVRSLKWTATYQRGWSAVREVAQARRDATSSSVSEPWYSNQSIPSFQFEENKKIITIQGPIALGPEFVGTDPVGIIDDPQVIFVDTVPINKDPVCPCSHLETIEAKGALDTWVVVTPNGKGKTESDLAFLKHADIEFDLKADKASSFAVTGTPTMKLENGKGKNSPVLTGTIANDDLKKSKLTEGSPCPVTIPSVKCPIESPKKK
jgi:hypothetical protein